MDDRLDMLEQWLREERGMAGCLVVPASGDASFRRYFRVTHRGQTWIVMDAPPDKEDCHPFVKIAKAMGGMGLSVPEVLAADFDKGLLLLSDLGTRQYLAELNETTVSHLYGDAMQALMRLQQGPTDRGILPPYSRTLLLNEMGLFRDWFLGRHLGLVLTEEELVVLDQAFTLLADSALEQPMVWVHRDYHSRNLMVLQAGNPGILDFQDAVIGPVTYDLVSLLKDCYIAWPATQIQRWVEEYYQLIVDKQLINEVGMERFRLWFERMGVQRHLKAAGIFARLNIRDHKPGYLQDIPRTFSYIMQATHADSSLIELRNLLQRRAAPLV
ncbi:MAG: phosphotransferase [Gammaproteobacteria bacterium]|nr:phosphotransferase [Gammaproteobacteria bacterium]